MRNHSWLAALPIAVAAAATDQARASSIACDVSGNLVSNCGFEDSTPSPWTVPYLSPFDGHTGTQSAQFSTDPVQQTISGLVVGQAYNLSFWWSDQYFSDNRLRLNVTIGGTALFTDLVQSDFYTFNLFSTSFIATSTTADLAFVSATSGGYGLIDDVVITSRSVVTEIPEPAGLAVLGAGLVGLAGLRRRRAA